MREFREPSSHKASATWCRMCLSAFGRGRPAPSWTSCQTHRQTWSRLHRISLCHRQRGKRRWYEIQHLLSVLRHVLEYDRDGFDDSRRHHTDRVCARSRRPAAIDEALSLIRLKDLRVLDAGAKALWCRRPIVERALKRHWRRTFSHTS